MSQAQHAVLLRTGIKMGDGTLTDTMLSDGLIDAFQNGHMGITGTTVPNTNFFRENIRGHLHNSYLFLAYSGKHC